jgi:WD40 repeat protein
VPDVFVSYSRRDATFVRRLIDSIEQQGKTAWIDTEGIGDGEVFPQAIRTAIEQSDAFVFVITPEAVASSFCEQEVEYATQLQKRVVPLLRVPVPDPDLPQAIRERNWIQFTEDEAFGRSVDRLITALDTDLAHAKEHTRWLVKAVEWDGEGRDRSFLLRGAELAAAERWLASATGKDPEPSTLQFEYVYASRAASSRRQRAVVGASLSVALVAVGLLVFALVSRQQAISERTTAKSRALAAQSANQLETDPELSILLGMEAVRTSPTPDALFALRQAIDQSPLRLTLPNEPRQECDALPGIAYRPGGGQLARGLCNGDVVMLDARSGRQLRRLHVADNASVVAYSPDGALLAVGTERGVRLLEAESGARRRHLAGSGVVTAIAFAGDGSRVAATTTEGVFEWNVRTGRRRVLARARHEFVTLAFAGDDRLLLVGNCGCEGMRTGIRVYDERTGRLVRMVRSARKGWIDDIAVSLDGASFALADLDEESGVGRVSVWDTRRWRRTASIVELPAVEVTTIGFSPDGTRLAVGAADGTAGLWSVRGRRQLMSFLGHTSAIGRMAFSPDAREIVTTSTDGTARVWSLRGMEQVAVDAAGDVGAGGVIGARGLTAIVDGSAVKVWGLPQGRLKASFPIESDPQGWPAILSPDGSLAGSSLRRAIVIWDVAKRRVVRRLPPSPRSLLAFSRDASQLAMLPDKKPVAIVDLRSGGRREMQQSVLPCRSWRGTSFSADGRLFAGGTFCGQVVVWQAGTGRRVASFTNRGQIAGIAFNHDGTLLAVASWDSTLTVWNVRSGRPERVLHGPSRGLTSVAFSPDGSMLAAGSLSRTVWLWDARSGRRLRILRHPDVVGVGSFSRDGRLVTAENGTLRVFDPCEGCRDPDALLAIAETRVTRPLTPLERSTFLEGF